MLNSLRYLTSLKTGSLLCTVLHLYTDLVTIFMLLSGKFMSKLGEFLSEHSNVVPTKGVIALNQSSLCEMQIVAGKHKWINGCTNFHSIDNSTMSCQMWYDVCDIKLTTIYWRWTMVPTCTCCHNFYLIDTLIHHLYKLV